MYRGGNGRYGRVELGQGGHGALSGFSRAGALDRAGGLAHTAVRYGRVHDGAEATVGVICGGAVRVPPVELVVPRADHAGRSGQPAELDLAEGREDVQPQEALVLAPGAVGQVGALHPGAGVLLEGLLAPVRVDPGATSEVGLGVGQPGAGVGLGGERPLGVDPPALVLVVGPVTLGGQPFYGAEQAALHPSTITAWGLRGDYGVATPCHEVAATGTNWLVK